MALRQRKQKPQTSLAYGKTRSAEGVSGQRRSWRRVFPNKGRSPVHCSLGG